MEILINSIVTLVTLPAVKFYFLSAAAALILFSFIRGIRGEYVTRTTFISALLWPVTCAQFVGFFIREVFYT